MAIVIEFSSFFFVPEVGSALRQVAQKILQMVVRSTPTMDIFFRIHVVKNRAHVGTADVWGDSNMHGTAAVPTRVFPVFSAEGSRNE